MTAKNINIEYQAHNELINNSLSNVRKGKGSIICVSGETGFGKTQFLNSIMNSLGVKDSGVVSTFVQCDAPIGAFNVGNSRWLGLAQRVRWILRPESVVQSLW